MTKQKAFRQIFNELVNQRLKPVMEAERKPIAVRPELYENDYLEWQAKQRGQLVHIHNKKEV